VTITGRPFDRAVLESRLRQQHCEGAQLDERVIQKMIILRAAALPLLTPVELYRLYKACSRLPSTATKAYLLKNHDLAFSDGPYANDAIISNR
jgi:hypothetical protein